MARQVCKGVELIEEAAGKGAAADKGSRIRYAARIFLSRGDEVTRDAELIAKDSGYLKTKIIDGAELVLHATQLGKRQTIAGIEKALLGMAEGGYREVRIAPHLAYGEKGVPGLIPPDAILRVKLWLVRIESAT